MRAVRTLRRVGVTVLGGGLVALGLALTVLPGPGVLTVVAGLAVLASEYAWARRLYERSRASAEKAAAAAVSSRASLAASVALGVGFLVAAVVLLVLQPEVQVGPLGASPVVLGVTALLAGALVLVGLVVQVRQAKALLREGGRVS